jgi:branched-chain amino acid transport system permease protein
MKAGRGVSFAIAVAIIAFIEPFLSPFLRVFVTESMAWILLAMSFNLLWGYTGLLSFGQAMFFGTGAYGVVLSVLRLNLNLWASLLIAITLCIVIGLGVGSLAIRVRGHNFFIMTVIFSVILYMTALNWRWLTGGDDGLNFTPPPLSLAFADFPLLDYKVNYYYVLALFAIMFFVFMRLVSSPFGKALIAIKENEERAKCLGYNVQFLKLASFTISAIYAGLGGALYAITAHYASATFYSIEVSANALAYSLVGGSGKLLGPIIGTGLLVTLTTYLSRSIIGLIIILVITKAPKGIVGIIGEKLRGR